MNEIVRPLVWSELPAYWKAIKVAGRIAAAAGVICLFTALGIQGDGVHPRTPDARHTHPIQVKNHVEYLTDTQAWVLDTALMLTLVFFPMLFVLGGAELYLRQTDIAKR